MYILAYCGTSPNPRTSRLALLTLTYGRKFYFPFHRSRLLVCMSATRLHLISLSLGLLRGRDPPRTLKKGDQSFCNGGQNSVSHTVAQRCNGPVSCPITGRFPEYIASFQDEDTNKSVRFDAAHRRAIITLLFILVYVVIVLVTD